MYKRQLQPFSNYYHAKSPASIPGFAIAREQHQFILKKGSNIIAIDTVPKQLDPTTILFSSLTSPKDTYVNEQQFSYGISNTQELLQHYIGKAIVVERVKNERLMQYKGTLISADQGIILKDVNNNLLAINTYDMIHFPTLSPVLSTDPNLTLSVSTQTAGKHLVELSYLTQGITWSADYNALFIPSQNPHQGTLP